MLEDIATLQNCTISSVPDGYDAFLLAKLQLSAKHDIIYVVSDGVSLEHTAQILNTITPQIEVLKFPAWDTVPYDRVSPNVNVVASRVETLSTFRTLKNRVSS